MEFIDFQCFIKICRYGSITDAARSIFVSQQALSARMKKLENELGAALFTRSKKGITLTDFGQKVFERFAPILDDYDNAVHELHRELTADAGEIVFSITPYVFDSLGPDIITGFSRKHPHYLLNISELNENELSETIPGDKGRFWIVSDMDAEQFKQYQSVPITSFHRNLILHKDHRLARKKSLRFTDIIDERFFALNQRMALERLVNQHLAESGKQLNIIQRGSDPILFLEMINQNEGVMIAAPIISDSTPFENILQIPILDSFLDFCPAFVYANTADLKKQDKDFINYVLDQVNASTKK